ncbi:MAG: PstS family phosphate ABC transporter substrate-binding protein [Bdellovibrionales bacterium]
MFRKFFTGLLIVMTSATTFGATGDSLKGRVMIDGSSTVFPITEAVAEDFRSIHPRVRVAIGVSGTGGGFKKYLNRESDINNASRSIKGSEIELAKTNKIAYEEIPVAYDGISVVVHPENDWASNITVAELKKIWQPGSQVKTWKDVRSTWPDKPIRLYGPGTDSGTFDYFTEAVNGKSHVSRSDYTKAVDPNVLVQGVINDKYALAYFGFSYYNANKAKLKALSVAVNDKAAPVAPTEETINNGTYKPLARAIYIYVNPESLKNQSVLEFTKHYMTAAPRLVSEVGYVPLPDSKYQENLARLQILVK